MSALRRACLVAALAAAWLAIAAPSAGAAFGFLPAAEGFHAALQNEDGSPDSQAGSHPYELRVGLGLTSSGQLSEGDLRDLRLVLPAGLLVSPTVQECRWSQFNTPRSSPYQESLSGESCPDPSQVGVVAIRSSYAGGSTRYFGVFNLAPPSGTPAAIGFSPFGIPIVLTAQIRESDGALTFNLENLSQRLDLQRLDLTLWGTPWASPSHGWWTFLHDDERGNCLNEVDPAAYFGHPATLVPGANGQPPAYTAGTCSVGGNPLLSRPRAYLSLPTSCGLPMAWEVSARSWQGEAVRREAFSEDAEGHSLSPTECVEPLSAAEVHLGTESAASPASFIFSLESRDEGLNAEGRIRSTPRLASMRLPEGLTINPSVGSGLGTCSAADFAREAIDTPPGQGCPNDSKIGNVSVEGLLGFSAPVRGSVFLAAPYENPFGSLLAVYLTLASPERGIFLRSQGEIEPDPHSGRLTVTFRDLPQLYYTRFSLTLREGQRAVMISPPLCGEQQTDLELTPWSDPELHLHAVSPFEITHGERGGPCPTGGLPPFHPQLTAGSLSSQAGAYSPFYLQMTRTDSEQEITSYSALFPPGLLAKLAGIPYCPDGAIEAAKRMTGAEELAHPSCPADSSIGHTVTGYGVGGVLAYAPGGLFLAGPYHGAPLSVVAVDSALVGPFDLGVVVVRSAIRIDPRTAQASIDSSGSDPIPHILDGIPLHVRDIRVFVDRPGFTLNPTDCDPLQSVSTLTGAGADFFSPADDVVAASSARFQVLGCPELGFAPRLHLRLVGGTRRGSLPSLRATYLPTPGQANLSSAQVTLPPSLFLEQGHIGVPCTIVQFKAQSCPPGSVYGKARAVTPLLDRPMEGPVYLRSSSGKLPDLVAALNGPAGPIEVDGQIDSSRGGLRGTFSMLPDAPLTSFTMVLWGGAHGVLADSEDLCAKRQLASARFVAQDNATEVLHPRVSRSCPRHRKAHPRHRGRRQ